jgi:ChrR Cupin-like domain
MHCFRTLCLAAGLASMIACGSSDDDSTAKPQPEQQSLTSSTILKLDDVKANPTDYGFMDFKPNVQKLILAGAADSEHVAVLWYTVTDGGVGLHYHAKTESVYVIDGTQTDAKGVYPTGTVYFNPPGSGHEITDSSGFFLLAYAAPPDFASTDLIGEYTPIRIDTDADDLTSKYPFEETMPGVRTFAPALDSEGGMSAEFIETTSSKAYEYTGNYLLVVKGSCDIEGMTFGEDRVVVSKTIEPQPYEVTASKGSTCLAMGVSF